MLVLHPINYLAALYFNLSRWTVQNWKYGSRVGFYYRKHIQLDANKSKTWGTTIRQYMPRNHMDRCDQIKIYYAKNEHSYQGDMAFSKETD